MAMQSEDRKNKPRRCWFLETLGRCPAGSVTSSLQSNTVNTNFPALARGLFPATHCSRQMTGHSPHLRTALQAGTVFYSYYTWAAYCANSTWLCLEYWLSLPQQTAAYFHQVERKKNLHHIHAAQHKRVHFANMPILFFQFEYWANSSSVDTIIWRQAVLNLISLHHGLHKHQSVYPTIKGEASPPTRGESDGDCELR